MLTCCESQVTALGQPNLLERMSQVLADVGGTLDRGHSSGQLRQVLAGSLSAHELRAFDNLMRRMHELASAAYEKVRPPTFSIGM